MSNKFDRGQSAIILLQCFRNSIKHTQNITCSFKTDCHTICQLLIYINSYFSYNILAQEEIFFSNTGYLAQQEIFFSYTGHFGSVGSILLLYLIYWLSRKYSSPILDIWLSRKYSSRILDIWLSRKYSSPILNILAQQEIFFSYTGYFGSVGNILLLYWIL